MLKDNEIVNFSITFDELELAKKAGESVINKDNKECFFYERLAVYAFENYLNETLYEEDNYLPINYYLPNSLDKTLAIRELFSMNYINVNGHFIHILNVATKNQTRVDIPKKLFESHLAPDFYAPVYVNPKTMEVVICGYFEHKTVSEKGYLSSIGNTFSLDLDKCSNIENLMEILYQPKEIADKILNYEEVMSFEHVIKELKKMENALLDRFPNNINNVANSMYIAIASSEELSREYLNLQNEYKKVTSSEELSKKYLKLQNEYNELLVGKSKKDEVVLNAQIEKQEPESLEKEFAEHKLETSPLESQEAESEALNAESDSIKFARVNLERIFKLVSEREELIYPPVVHHSSPKLSENKIEVFEYKDNEFKTLAVSEYKLLDSSLKGNIFKFELELPEKYTNKNWILFIDRSEESMEVLDCKDNPKKVFEKFFENPEKDFSDLFFIGSTIQERNINEKGIIDFDVELKGEFSLPSKYKIYFAILI